MAEVLASLKKIGGNGEQYTETVLWTNPSPTATFAGQNVTLSDSITNYKYMKITWKTTTSDTAYSSAYVLVSDLASMTATNGSCFMSISCMSTNVYKRNVTYNSATSIGISTSYRENASGNNNGVNIPLEILGINELAHGKKLPETILWTNSNPSVDFANQTITLSDSLANYDLLKLTYELSRNNTALPDKVVYVDLSSFVADNNGRFAFGGTYSSNYGRLLVKVSDTSVTISDSKAFGGTTTANSTMIPLQLSGCIIS